MDCHVELRALDHRNRLSCHSSRHEQSWPFVLLLDFEYVLPQLANGFAETLTAVAFFR